MAAIKPQSLLGQIPYFLQAVLSTPAGALPKGPLWVVVFDFDENIKNTIKSVKNYEPKMPAPWQIDSALNTITSDRFQKNKGCLLTQTVNIPGESLITNVEGVQYNGYIRGRVGAGRQDFDTLQIGFLKTNVNFVDNVIRPWTVMTGHLGMIARPKEQKYRCDIIIYQLGVYDFNTSPIVLQRYSFKDACPISVEGETLNYNSDYQVIKNASFAYQWYTTDSVDNLFADNKAPGIAFDNTADIRRATLP
jgi:hypothetical protein